VREGSGGLGKTELAYTLALAQHVEFGMWSKPVMLHGIHFEIAAKLLPVLPKIKR
jgi:hypothetical protein